MELNKIFTSHMVFAANKPIRIYGNGKGKVEIRFLNQSRICISNEEFWMVEFPPMGYGGPYHMEVIFEDRSMCLKDIYIGKVFLFAGQSNIELKMQETNSKMKDYKINEKLRLFSTDKVDRSDYFTSDDGWVLCKKEEVEKWSAIAFLVGEKIVEEKNVAVGCIACYKGASVIESWVPEGTFKPLKVEEKHPDHIHEEYSRWNMDGFLYEYALSQVIPYSLSGVIWYQGESDTSESEGLVYADELSELINIWRRDFKDDVLPFIIIQITDYIERKDCGWKLVQEAQLKVQSILPFVNTVISSDICENDNIHPKTKDKLANRVYEKIMKI